MTAKERKHYFWFQIALVAGSLILMGFLLTLL